MTWANHRLTMSLHLDGSSPSEQLFRKNRVSELKFVFVFPSRREVRFRISGESFEPERSHPTQQIWLPPLRSAFGHYLLTPLYHEVLRYIVHSLSPNWHHKSSTARIWWSENTKRIRLISRRHEDELELRERKENGDEDEEKAEDETKTNGI
jgi:hypothetical protein